MGLGLGISVDWASLVPYYAKVASAFAARVKADGGTVENTACLKKDLKALNPIEPTGYLLTDYPGAAAAYSLRLINKTYAGSAIRVRRATDNAEQNIGFASKQLDTETLESFVNSGEAFTDPDITSSYNWTKGANTTYNAATEALDLLNENGLTARQGVSVSGHTYTITIVLDSVTSGGIKIYAGGTQSAVISTAGTHTLEITASNSNNILGINPSGAATCSISRFSAIDTTADAFVTTWYDQSGNGVNATQTSASSQPKIVSSGSTILENGKPCVSYGGNDNLLVWNNTTAPTLFQDMSDAISVLLVEKATAISNSGSYWINGNTTMELRVNRSGGDSLTKVPYSIGYESSKFAFGVSSAGTADSEQKLSGAITSAQRLSISFVNGDDLDVYLNSSSAISTTFATATGDRSVGTTDSTFAIGSRSRDGGQADTSYFLGTMQEIVLYKSNESSNRTGIETNINDFYSIY